MDTFIESTSMRLQHTEDDNHNTLYNEKKWEWSFLRRKCRNLELEQFYESYMQRLSLSFISIFICIGICVATLHTIYLAIEVQPLITARFDIIVYFAAAILVGLALLINYYDEFINRQTWVMYASSWVATTILVTADLGVAIYGKATYHYNLRPSYGNYILYAIYIFLPLPNNFHALILGLAVSASYLVTYAFVTYQIYKKAAPDYTKLESEAIFLLCINILGIYFRVMKEIAIRTTFLDRRQCVEENLLLRYARDQERSLLLSIIPAQIANKIEQDVKIRIEHIKQQNQSRDSTSSLEPRKLFIEPHNDVSVLYADVVNYTQLTTTLDVKTLVGTIHDLFVKFDTASEEYNVLRIKFLGDCYYCVAGVPMPNEQHAKCCVLLGLRMIKDIRDVRQKRQLDIDMRIGVHSGNILSGVIGANKWQFDIWSKDVDVANRLESTGVAGRVHVSEQTLKLLDGEFVYEEGTQKARDDEVLRKYQIRTFLIKPPKGSTTYISMKNQTGPQGRQGVNFRNSIGVRRYMETVPAKADPSQNFMQNTISQYNQIRAQAKLEMNRELDKMPIGRVQLRKCCGHSKRLTQDEMEEQSFRSNITSCFLFFKDWRWEVLFMKEPDIMLKYSVLCGVIIYFAIMATQAINGKLSTRVWIFNIVNSVFMLVFLVIVWYRKLWIMLVAEAESSLPETPISRIMYNLSDKVQSNILARIIIFLAMVIMHCLCAMLQMVDCDRTNIENDEIDMHILHDGEWNDQCFNPWAVTESLALTICMCFLFTRIPFAMKLFTGTLIFVIYATMAFFEFDFIFEKSPSTNIGVNSECAHVWMLFITLVIFHIMDRQTEFISKVDYNWKRQLQKKQNDAKFTNETIKILINNILPSHVADIYITKQMKNELYYEEYENVAVMFATIKNYDTEKVGLRVLNEIICDFDSVLNSYKGMLKIEKIKVAGWTYMAACGLDIARSESSIGANRNSSLLPNGRRSYYDSSSKSSQETVVDIPHVSSSHDTTAASYEGHSVEDKKKRKISSPQQSNVVFVMAQFALDLMRTMHAFNTENLQYEDGDKGQGMLSIGISNGEIMAGVVGSYKPHYDIWGNAVNMASRMDSTGKPGKIQVTEETANILKTFDIHCAYRGETYVKGRGKIPTYFIAIDKNLNFTQTADASSFMSGITLVNIPASKPEPEVTKMFINEISLSQTPSEELIEKKISEEERKLVAAVPETSDESESTTSKEVELEEAAQEEQASEEAEAELAYRSSKEVTLEEAAQEEKASEREKVETEQSLSIETSSEELISIVNPNKVALIASTPQNVTLEDAAQEKEASEREKVEEEQSSSIETSSEELMKIVNPNEVALIESTSQKSELKEVPSIEAEPIADAPLEAGPVEEILIEAVPSITSEASSSLKATPVMEVLKEAVPSIISEVSAPLEAATEKEVLKETVPSIISEDSASLEATPKMGVLKEAIISEASSPLEAATEKEVLKEAVPSIISEASSPLEAATEKEVLKEAVPSKISEDSVSLVSAPEKEVFKGATPKLKSMKTPKEPSSKSETQNVATDVMKIDSNSTLEGLTLNIVMSDRIEVPKPEVSKHEIPSPTVSRSDVPKPEVAKPVLPKPASRDTIYYSNISVADIVRKHEALKPTVTNTEVTKSNVLARPDTSTTTLYYSDISDEDQVSKTKAIKPVVAKPEVPETVVPKTASKETIYYSNMSDIDSVSKRNADKPKVSKTEVAKPGALKADSKGTLYFSNKSDDELVSTASEHFYDTISNDELSQSKSKKK